MNNAQHRNVLVLDAMGVLYQACDDVEELLIPFVTSLNRDVNVNTVKRLYVEASLGKITSDRFWSGVGVLSENEDDYLNRHKCSQASLNSSIGSALTSMISFVYLMMYLSGQ